MQLAKDKRIPYYFVAFFIGLAIVDGIMVTLALRTHTGTVSAHPYEEGLAYNRTIAAAEAQAALGWHAAFEFVQQSAQQGEVWFALEDAQGTPLSMQHVRVEFTRPTSRGHDFELPLLQEGTQYRAHVAFPLQGLWEMRVHAARGDTPFQQSRRIVVK